MKKLYFSICLVLFSASGFAQWSIIDTIGYYSYLNYSIQFIARYTDDGFYSKFYTDDSPSESNPVNMYVFKTANDGQNWTNIISNSDYSLSSYDLAFPVRDTGFFSYNYYAHSYLVRTINGGSSWTSISNSGPINLFFINARKGYGIKGNIIYRYESDSIKHVDSIPYKFYSPKLFFTPNKIGYAIYSKVTVNPICNHIIKSIDDGDSWNALTIDTTHNFIDLFFPSDTVGYLLCDSGRIYKTINGGQTWSVLNTGYIYLNSLYFTDNNKGFVVGYSGILRTDDGGDIWQNQTLSNVSPFYIKMINDTVGYITATSSSGSNNYTLVLKTTNAGLLTNLGNQFQYPPINIYPNPTSSFLTIDLLQKSEIEIIDLEEKILERFNSTDKITTIDLSELSKGIYIIKAINASGITIKKFIKE